jgi:hypothetical protein
MAAENSEVSPLDWLVAVALTTCPAGTTGAVALKLASSLPLVVTLFWPINFWLSQLPDASALRLLKNWRVKVVLAVLLSVPWMVVLSPVFWAEESTGKFCRLFPPCPRRPCRWR